MHESQTEIANHRNSVLIPIIDSMQNTSLPFYNKVQTPFLCRYGNAIYYYTTFCIISNISNIADIFKTTKEGIATTTAAAAATTTTTTTTATTNIKQQIILNPHLSVDTIHCGGLYSIQVFG